MFTRREFIRMGLATGAGLFLSGCAPAAQSDLVVATEVMNTLQQPINTVFPTNTVLPIVTEKPTKSPEPKATPDPWVVVPDNIKMGLPKEGYTSSMEGDDHVILRSDGSVSYRFYTGKNAYIPEMGPVVEGEMYEPHEAMAFGIEPKNPKGLYKTGVNTFVWNPMTRSYWAGYGLYSFEDVNNWLIQNGKWVSFTNPKGENFLMLQSSNKTKANYSENEHMRKVGGVSVAGIGLVVFPNTSYRDNIAGIRDWYDLQMKDNLPVSRGRSFNSEEMGFAVVGEGDAARLIFIADQRSLVNNDYSRPFDIDRIGFGLRGDGNARERDTIIVSAMWEAIIRTSREWDEHNKKWTDGNWCISEDNCSRNIPKLPRDITPDEIVFRLIK